MLNSSRSVEVNKLLDLGLLLPGRRLIDRHLDGLLVVGDDHGAEGGVLGVDLRIVHRPEPVEEKVPLVPPSGVVHAELGLVPHDVVDVVDLRGGEPSQQGVLVQRGLVAWPEKCQPAESEGQSQLTWQKETFVAGPLHEGVGGVPVGLHPGEPHLPALVLLLPDLLHHLHPPLPALDHDPLQVLHVEGDILDPVTVISQMSAHLLTDG